MKTQNYHLLGPDGKPFFWLADTAWNLWCKGVPDEWDEYLSLRKHQGFNVIQFVTSWWRGCTQPVHGHSFEVVDGKVVFHEAAMKTLDLLVAKIRDAGMVVAPVMLWAHTGNDPGQSCSEEHCIEIARTLLERYDAPDVVWLLSGDGHHERPEDQERWKRIGRKVFAGYPDAVATLHPHGVSWVGDFFAGEPWYDIVAIQSGHGSQSVDLQFLLDADYAEAWRRIDKPFLNLEPNYENAISYGVGKHLTAYHVRRAAYWSLTVAPPAGITYGIGSVWMWAREEGEIAENHSDNWRGRPWREDLETPGAGCMTHLRALFEQLPWTRLRPAMERLIKQPGLDNFERWQSVSATPEGDCLVAYAPCGGRMVVNTDGLDAELTASRVNPSTGEWTEARTVCNPDGTLTVALPEGDERDSLLVLR